jgi:hypothetical protein
MYTIKWWMAAALSAVVVACSMPTDACGCTPARSAAIVRGVLLDRDGQPLPNARLGLDGIPRGNARLDSLPVSAFAVARTNADGSFRVVVYSGFSPDTLLLRIALMPDTVTTAPAIFRTLLRFRREGEQSDSIVSTVRVP